MNIHVRENLSVGFLSMMLCLCLLLPTQVYAQPEIQTKQISDNRLLKRVSLHAQHIYLGELLEEVSNETGVSLSMDANDIYSGIPLSVSTKGITLNELMQSLRSLLSYKHAAWKWSSLRSKNEVWYVLAPSDAFRNLAGRLESAIQAAFEQQAEIFIQLAYMKPEERAKNVPLMMRALKMKSDGVAKSYVADNPDMEKFWSVIRFFNEALSSEQKQQVLHGGDVHISIASLSEPLQELAKVVKEYRITRTVDGVDNTPPPSTTIDIYYNRMLGSTKRLCPMIMIGRGKVHASYIGLLDFGIRDIVAEEWLLDGDTKTGKFPSKVVAPVPVSKKENKSLARLNAVAAGSYASMLAILPDALNPDVGDPTGMVSSVYLNNLEEHAPFVMYKWRTDCLLFNYTEWFFGDDALFPYAWVKALRKTLAENNNYPSLKFLSTMLNSSSSPQTTRLQKTFELADLTEEGKAILTLYGQFPGLLSAKGLPLSAELLQFLRSLGIAPGALDLSDNARLRLADHPTKASDESLITLLQVMDKEGNWRMIAHMTRSKAIEKH